MYDLGLSIKQQSPNLTTPFIISDLLDLALERLVMLVQKLRTCRTPHESSSNLLDLQDLKRFQGAASRIGGAGSIWKFPDLASVLREVETGRRRGGWVAYRRLRSVGVVSHAVRCSLPRSRASRDNWGRFPTNGSGAWQRCMIERR